MNHQEQLEQKARVFCANYSKNYPGGGDVEIKVLLAQFAMSLEAEIRAEAVEEMRYQLEESADYYGNVAAISLESLEAVAEAMKKDGQ